LCCGPYFGDDDGADEFGDGVTDFAFLNVDEDDFPVVDGVLEVEAAFFGSDDSSDGGVHHEVVQSALEGFQFVAGHILFDSDELFSSDWVFCLVDEVGEGLDRFRWYSGVRC